MRGLVFCFCSGVALAVDYDQSEAILFANLATAAYCGYPRSSKAAFEAWDCGPACDAVAGMTDVRQIVQYDNNDAFAFVGKLNGECVISFRGTSDLQGWITDLKSADLVDLTGASESKIPCSYNGNRCHVGDGFMTNYNSIAPFVRGNLTDIGCGIDSPITVTGHSLGAAEAAICMYDLQAKNWTIKQTYTFGQPRVGDKNFQQAFERDLGDTLVYRLTHYHDPVVHLPGENIFNPGNVGFVHIAKEVYYQEKVSSGYKVCNGSGEDKSCGDSDTNILAMIIACLSGGSDCDHLTYLMPLKSTHMDGSSCTNGSALMV
eukprot:TRINITY_DN33360_c0_g1_i1.p1 TRINITY_DN33360_c0_g1~~TRINITY_DN33360_c0_g1_i1.p1  ORF type:complete len:318 (+),score=40.20 TRINITY_DN33360_c0_g1_i1:60-1013(+)